LSIPWRWRAQLLAEVYLSMTRGQDSLTIDIVVPMAVIDGALASEALADVRVLMPSEDELALHRAYLADLQRESRGVCLWVVLPA
jgi:DNA polymerase-3 subunit epsilon